MGFLERVLEKYKEALEELMGAQNYANAACHAKTMDDRNKYIEMSRDELKHADNISKMADMMVGGANDESASIAWHALHMHIKDWSDRISEKLDRTIKH